MRIGGFILVLLLGWAISASAATLFLKDGGTIKAKRIWREKGKVVVLVTRESITSFAASEVNLKKTFPPHHRKKKRAVAKAAEGTAQPVVPVTSPAEPAKAPKAAKKPVFSVPDVPKPELTIPHGSQEGAIRKQKREMEERLND